MDGDYVEEVSISKPFKKKFPAGEYLIMYQADWTELHPMRKLVISGYADNKLEMKRVNNETYSMDRFLSMEECLGKRMNDIQAEIEFPVDQ